MTPRIHPKSLPITPGWLRFGTALEQKPKAHPLVSTGRPFPQRPVVKKGGTK